ncbi:MAG TPA: family 78 glycoside hydrolase catalytic domain [Clostridia bacterium]|mgnify:FL=1|nr:family 78 glycoside hydrolase catalytic domain [Clostridia bacterium]
MIFENIDFISAGQAAKDNDNVNDPALMFRKLFHLESGYTKAILYVAGLGIGYHYINGISVSEDLFTSATSEYTKTIWYNRYDVTNIIKQGDNTACSLLGNGFFNESLKTAWDFDKAPWRNVPRLIYRLDVYYEKGKYTIVSDESWKVTDNCYITYNQLRSGEHCDLRKYDPLWMRMDYDDSSWKNAVRVTKPPYAEFRELISQPIKECGIYPVKTVKKTSADTYLFDIGQNISGYIRIDIDEDMADPITIRYAESINEDKSLNLNKMDRFYKESAFQTDRIIPCGTCFTWSPKFTYHGFRYMEISGLKKKPKKGSVKGVFVHQDIRRNAYFECSDENLTKLCEMGILATYSNLFHIPTDCPTREKLGWTNDARASCEQMLINFDMTLFFRKYMQDIYDAMLDDGALPGIIPSSGWGYKWGSGPISSGILYEIPYRYYKYTADDSLLKESFAYFIRHLEFIKNKRTEEGFISYGLCDWAGPYEHLDKSPVPLELTDSIMYYSFLNTTDLASKILDLPLDDNLLIEKEDIKNRIMKKYIDNSGRCTVDEQASISMLIFYDLYENINPLKDQLKENIEKYDFHHHCGMLGLRHLYDALTKCSLSDYAYRIITANGYPSYIDWITKRDATTLCETFQDSNSQNHHMWSDFMAWIMKNLAGIQPKSAGFDDILVNPYLPDNLTYVNACMNTHKGKISVSWQKTKDIANFSISIPSGSKAKIYLQNAIFADTGLKEASYFAGDYSFKLSML